MKSGKSRVFWSLIFVAIAAVSIWAVASQAQNFSVENFFNCIASSNKIYLGLAVLCMLSFIFFEALAVLRIIKAFGYKRSIRKGLLYSASDIYFSAITPSATGGQPVCAYFMVKDGIPGGIVTVSLLLNLVLYTISIMVAGIAAIIIKPSLFFNFHTPSKVLIIIGYTVLSGLTVLFILLIGKADFVYRVCDAVLRFLKRIHLLKKYDAINLKLKNVMKDYSECAGMIRDHKRMVVEAFLYNFIQRMSQMIVPSLVYLAVGGTFSGAVNVWITQIMVTMGSNYFPIPGAMGVIDYLMLDGLSTVMTPEEATNLDLLSRSVSFYICVLLCAVWVIFGFIRYGAKKNKDNVVEVNNEGEQ